MSGTLYLLPVPIADATAESVLPASTLSVARRLDLFFAENAKTARTHLKTIGHPQPMAAVDVIEIGHRPDHVAVDGWLRPLREGRDAAVVSEAGCPGIADPGAELAARAHAMGLRVRPLVGPSAILLALMASGLNGQAFRFLGYLPREAAELASRLKEIEHASTSGETQVWIETPYRNARMLDAVLAACRPDTRVSVAVDLTAQGETVIMQTVAQWKSCPAAERPVLQKRPAVFALLAPDQHRTHASTGPASGRGGSR